MTTASAPCAGCGNTAQATQYNTNGDKTRELAHDGSVIFYAYDAQGREAERAIFPASFNTATSRPALANATRVVSTLWHATWHLPLQVAEPNKLSAYTYDAKGNLTGQSDLPTSDATGAQAFSASPAGPPGVIAPGTVVDVVFVNDGVTVVNGVRTEDRNLIVENISVGGATPMLPTDAGVTVDQGDGSAAFDGIDTLPGQTGLWWNAALRFTVPAAHIGSAPTLKVRARATLAGGIGAKMVVRVGGAILGTVDVNNVGTAADYSFALPGATPPPAVPAGTGVDVVFTNDGVTVVNGVRTEDRNLIIESLSVGGGTPMLPTATGVTVDQGDGAAAFDGIDTLPGQGGLWWNAALRFAVPAAHIGTGSTLIVRAKATLAGGIGANMVVRVGGVVIGSATVSNTAAYADYSFPIPGAGGGSSGATSTGWSYDANSLPVAIVQKAGGIETGRWTLGYSAAGDVMSITDVTGGNLVGRAIAYDMNGRLLTATSVDGIPVGLSYSPRGFVRAQIEGGLTTTYVQNAVGLTSQATLPSGKTLTYEYDTNHRLVDIKLNGNSLANPSALSVTSLRSILNSPVRQTAVLLQRGLMAAIPSAQAQPAQVISRVTLLALPGAENPGRPPTDPWSVIMHTDGLSPMSTEALVRRIARSVREMCECDPNGYDRPTLSFLSISKMIASGHVPAVLGISIPGKSSFAPEVVPNQDLVDEVVRRAVGARPTRDGNISYYVSNMGRTMGTFAGRETRGVEIIVAPDCVPRGRPWKRNEVVSFYPAPENMR